MEALELNAGTPPPPPPFSLSVVDWQMLPVFKMNTVNVCLFTLLHALPSSSLFKVWLSMGNQTPYFTGDFCYEIAKIPHNEYRILKQSTFWRLSLETFGWIVSVSIVKSLLLCIVFCCTSTRDMAAVLFLLLSNGNKAAVTTLMVSTTVRNVSFFVNCFTKCG